MAIPSARGACFLRPTLSSSSSCQPSCLKIWSSSSQCCLSSVFTSSSSHGRQIDQQHDHQHHHKGRRREDPASSDRGRRLRSSWRALTLWFTHERLQDKLPPNRHHTRQQSERAIPPHRLHHHQRQTPREPTIMTERHRSRWTSKHTENERTAHQQTCDESPVEAPPAEAVESGAAPSVVAAAPPAAYCWYASALACAAAPVTPHAAFAASTP